MKKKERAEVLQGKTYMQKTGCGKIYMTINRAEDGSFFEVFLNMGKVGGCAFAQCEGLGRLISYCFRIGGDINEIIKELIGIHCHNNSDAVSSCADAIAKMLQLAIQDSDI